MTKFSDFDFETNTIPILGPPNPRTARGWAWHVNRVLSRKGKTLLDQDGRLRFTRAEFLNFSKETLSTIVAYGFTADVSRIPWGAMAGEEDSGDNEVDWDRLSSWLEER